MADRRWQSYATFYERLEDLLRHGDAEARELLRSSSMGSIIDALHQEGTIKVRVRPYPFARPRLISTSGEYVLGRTGQVKHLPTGFVYVDTEIRFVHGRSPPRPPPRRDYRVHDDVLVAFMQRAIEGGDDLAAAAERFAKSARGEGTLRSRKLRLIKRYRERYKKQM